MILGLCTVSRSRDHMFIDQSPNVRSKDMSKDDCPQRRIAPDLFDFLETTVEQNDGTIVYRDRRGNEHRLRVKLESEERSDAQVVKAETVACEASLPARIDALGEHAASEDPNADAIARALTRGDQHLSETLKRPEMKSADEMGDLMGITRQAVNDQHNAGRLLAISGGGRAKRYPDWQIGQDGKPLDGLREIIEALGQDWPSFRFLTRQDDEGSPLHRRLAEGDVADLVAKARGEASGAFS